MATKTLGPQISALDDSFVIGSVVCSLPGLCIVLILICSLYRYVEEHVQKTGVAIETQGFTFVTSGKKRESLTVIYINVNYSSSMRNKPRLIILNNVHSVNNP